MATATAPRPDAPTPDRAALAARRLRVLDGLAPGHLMVHEVYASIQGESTYAGLPCTFVRLTGCPLRCTYCDTRHAFHEGTPRLVTDVLADVAALAPRLVELTGGEPLSQPLAFDLMRLVADTGRKVLVETSGAVSIAGVDPRVTVVMDLKGPSSGEAASNDLRNVPLLKPTDEVKFVVADRTDFDWMVAQIDRHGLDDGRPLLVSPAFGRIDPALLCEWIVASGRALRFQPQLHKLVWEPTRRGV